MGEEPAGPGSGPGYLYIRDNGVSVAEYSLVGLHYPRGWCIWSLISLVLCTIRHSGIMLAVDIAETIIFNHCRIDLWKVWNVTSHD